MSKLDQLEKTLQIIRYLENIKNNTKNREFINDFQKCYILNEKADLEKNKFLWSTKQTNGVIFIEKINWQEFITFIQDKYLRWGGEQDLTHYKEVLEQVRNITNRESGN